MSLTISRAERDTLYHAIVLRLNGLDALQLAVTAEDWALARVLGCEFADLLQLVRDDLRWGDATTQQIVISSPPAVVRRAMTALNVRADEDLERAAADLDSASRELNDARLLHEACDRLLNWAHGTSTEPGQGEGRS